MGILSSTHAISRYHIEGNFEDAVVEKVQEGLIQYRIPETENEYNEISMGWTPIESPYQPDFNKFSFQFGTFFVFCFRIDKKSIPAKLIQKHMAIEIEKKKKKSGRNFISKNEKLEIKEMVIDMLMYKIPSVPNIYDVLWNYEEKNLYLYTTQKAVNEFFETIFLKSFNLKPIRLFPYTIIETRSKFTGPQKDKTMTLTPLKYLRG